MCRASILEPVRRAACPCDRGLDGADLKRTIGHGGTPMPMKPGQRMRLGNSSGSEYLKGLLDDVRIYDTALTQAQMTALASQPIPVAGGREAIGNLFRTGVDNNGMPLVDNAAAPHYAPIAQPSPGG